jgi:hypothetical protein
LSKPIKQEQSDSKGDVLLYSMLPEYMRVKLFGFLSSSYKDFSRDIKEEVQVRNLLNLKEEYFSE